MVWAASLSEPGASIDFTQTCRKKKRATAATFRSAAMLSNGGQSYVIYNASSNAVQLDLSAAKGTFRVYHINPRNGAQLKAEETVKGGNSISLKNSSSGPEVLWIKKI